MTILAALAWYLAHLAAALFVTAIALCFVAAGIRPGPRIFAGLMVLFLSLGCAHQPVVAPSGAAVASGIAQTQTHIATAQSENKSLTDYNAQQRTLAQRIHDKDILIDRWRETHRQ